MDKYFLSEYAGVLELTIVSPKKQTILTFEANDNDIDTVKRMVGNNALLVDCTRGLAYKNWREEKLKRSVFAFSITKSEDIKLRNGVIYLNKEQIYSL